ncbi:MAG TPA: disulfide bond formation protein B [Burkholderiales bacterium]|nr:disulfide bond formation protein B [Burkholderiales bacterium]
MSTITSRLAWAAVLLVSAGLLGFGLYLQHIEHLEPCPLCILQRLAFIATGLTGLVAAVHNPRTAGQAVYAGMLILFAGLGAGIAGWHFWLQHAPHGKAFECGPGIGYMLDAFPLSKALPMIFRGSGDCGNIVWSFLGLSIPGWALVWFILLVIVGLVLLTQALRQPKHATS